MVHACCALLFRLGDHGASHAAVIVLPHAVEAVVVEVALQIAFVIGAAGVAAERAAGAYRRRPRLGNIKAFIDSAVADHHLAVAVAIDVQRAAELRDVIPGGGEAAVGRQEAVGHALQSSRREDVGLFLGTGVHHAEIGVIKHHRAAAGNDIHIAFNVAVGHQGAGLTVVLQTVLHAAVGHEEGVLTAKNIDLIDLHLVAIAAQCHRLVGTGVNAVAEVVGDGQVLQLQTIIL
ncbi:Uncharacterised protein [Klebsiella pneumoniae]|nr:Uncharacterised protein [Klebsiella pneumoniae]